MRFDHILIRVDNLNETIHEFQEMGFNVYYGNAKKNPHHAMIYFSDDTFIEFIDQSAFPVFLKLLAKTKFLNLFGSFFKRIGFYVLSTNRFLDYSLYTSDIEQLHEQVKEKTTVSKIMNLKRVNHQKEKIMWKLFTFEDCELPFIMSDYIPKKYPEENATHHLNGITGIKEVVVLTKSIEQTIQKFQKLFGINVSSGGIITFENMQILLKKGDSFQIQSLKIQNPNTNNKYDFSPLIKYNITH